VSNKIKAGDLVRGWTDQNWNVASIHAGVASLVAVGGGSYPNGFVINTPSNNLDLLCTRVEA